MKLWKSNASEAGRYYLRIRDYYIAVRALVLILCVLILLPFLYIYRIQPVIVRRFFTKTMVVNSPEQFGYTGRVRLTDQQTGQVLFVGRLEEGRIRGEGILYDHEGNLIYQGGFEIGRAHV